MWKNVHPGYSAGIRTHNLQKMTLLTWPVDIIAIITTRVTCCSEQTLNLKLKLILTWEICSATCLELMSPLSNIFPVCKKANFMSQVLTSRQSDQKILLSSKYRQLVVSLPRPWSSLDEGESLASKITSPFDKKVDCFEKHSFEFYLKNNLAYCWMGKLSG